MLKVGNVEQCFESVNKIENTQCRCRDFFPARLSPGPAPTSMSLPVFLRRENPCILSKAVFVISLSLDMACLTSSRLH